MKHDRFDYALRLAALEVLRQSGGLMTIAEAIAIVKAERAAK